ncbi:MAG: glycosyltransferase family 4 protein [Helicobacteraceae bacterium]|jgi:N,N'-diacetylbacillosaminyl-diphospho-undecaprenol alpha-1,3-N-acetylgalactosaminyltransferase|nr:glycosyltransferase family 4 protein [Helicobacteraceae bacterium]
MEQKQTIVFLSHFDGNLYLFRLPIMRALARSGWRVVALVPSGEYSAKFAEFGVEHIDYKINRSGLNPFAEAAVIFRISKALKKIKPDILQCFTAKPNIYGAIAGKIAGVKNIYCAVTGLGSFFADNSLKSKALRAIILFGYKICAKLCVKILFQNNDDLNLFVDKKIAKKYKVLLIGSSGVDINYWRKSPEAKNDNAIAVLFVGRLIKHKGIFELLEAARNLKRKFGEKIKFIIVGGGDKGNLFNASGEAFSEYESIAVFEGEQKEVKPYYDRADIFVLPSYREGMPRAVLEAQAMSLPVVTTDAIGCRDAIENGVTGILVPVGDAEAIEKAIERLVADKTLRKKMGEAARERAEKLFDVNIVIKRYLTLYG